MTTVLLTGFGAFGTTLINPAQLVAEALDGAHLGKATIVSRVAPCTFFQCIAFVPAAITEVQPQLVIMLGEYGGRSLITVERLAHNLNDSARYHLADSEGLVLQDKPTVPGGPVAY
jgi:pyroglutamyl-peptidase